LKRDYRYGKAPVNANTIHATIGKRRTGDIGETLVRLTGAW
jgi:hypothetical protein